jgi:hypothetical protein
VLSHHGQKQQRHSSCDEECGLFYHDVRAPRGDLCLRVCKDRAK